MDHPEIAKKIEHEYTPEQDHVHGPGCSHDHHEARPYVREHAKVGRNDPCPCGSQQKFKKCHGK